MAKTKRPHPTRQISLPRIPRPILIVILTFVACIAAATLSLAAFTLRYQNRVYPNTYIGEFDLGGKTKSEALDAISHLVDTLPGAITVVAGGQSKAFPSTEVGLVYDADGTIQNLLAVGRVGPPTQNLTELLRAIAGRNDRVATYTVAPAKLEAKLAELAASVSRPSRDAAVIFESGRVSVRRSQEGFGVRVKTVVAQLGRNLGRFELTATLPLVNLQPAITETQAQAAVPQVEAYLAHAPVTLSVGNATTQADAKTVFGWIAYALTSPPTATPAPSASPLADRRRVLAQAPTILAATLDPTKIKASLAAFAIGVNREPQNAALRVDNGKVVVTKDHATGQRVKIDASAELIIQGLAQPDATPLAIALPVDSVEPAVQQGTIDRLGIKELIGLGETRFTGSPANRVHNITTGANFLNAAIVAPGEEFSTVKTLGKVDSSTGYLPELVILENRTTPEYGGGLCQVSTTLFRAVLNAGLKITERQNHSYRVSYYEPPIGLDATIYLPRPDFKFINDTPGYILVQSRIDGTKLRFELYGTKDGRVSAISDPIVSNITDPPDPIYADTDELPKGETKQIEKPHQGATAVVTYTVTRDGAEINQQVFKSRYKAWPARFLVGTREE